MHYILIMKQGTAQETRNENKGDKMSNTAIELKGKPQHHEYKYDTFKVGDRCHVRRYSDTEPATVVKVSTSGTKVTVRIDNYELAEGQKPEFISGGFVGHCTNQSSLKYNFSENTNGCEETYSLRKWRGRFVWTSLHGSPDGSQKLGNGWSAFYDYNF